MEIRIVGGSHAGIACAMRAREEYPDSNIVIYEKQRGIGFIAQSIPFYLAGDSNFLKLSSYIAISDLEKLDILVKTQTAVNNIEMEKKIISYTDLMEGLESEDHYDKLILATGSYPSLPLFRGSFHEELYVVKQIEDAVKIKKLMQHCRSVIIIGGGAIGVELARLMTDASIQTTLIHSSSYILNHYLDEEVAEEIQQFLESRGVEVLTNAIVTDIQEEEIDNKTSRKKVSHVYTRDGYEYIADGVIYATGFRPNSFLAGGQLELGDKGAIVVDEYMQTSHTDVFAVGDCATTLLTNVKMPTYVPHASDAIRQGEVAAINLVVPKVKLNKSQGTYNLNFDGDFTLCMTGINKEKAQKEGFKCEEIFIRDDYVNSSDYYEMWLIYEKVTHKILGMQSKGTAKEIASQADIISLAIQQGMTIEEFEYTDFYFKHGFKNPRSFAKILADKIRQRERIDRTYRS